MLRLRNDFAPCEPQNHLIVDLCRQHGVTNDQNGLTGRQERTRPLGRPTRLRLGTVCYCFSVFEQLRESIRGSGQCPRTPSIYLDFHTVWGNVLSYTASVEELDSLSTRPREHSDGEEEDTGDEAAPGKAEPRKTSAEIEASIMKARKVQRADRKAAAKATAKTKAMKAKKEPVERKVWTKRDKPKFDKNNTDPIDYEGGRIYCSFAKRCFRTIRARGEYGTESKQSWKQDEPTKTAFESALQSIDTYKPGKKAKK